MQAAQNLDVMMLAYSDVIQAAAKSEADKIIEASSRALCR